MSKRIGSCGHLTAPTKFGVPISLMYLGFRGCFPIWARPGLNWWRNLCPQCGETLEYIILIDHPAIFSRALKPGNYLTLTASVIISSRLN